MIGIVFSVASPSCSILLGTEGAVESPPPWSLKSLYTFEYCQSGPEYPPPHSVGAYPCSCASLFATHIDTSPMSLSFEKSVTILASSVENL